jgi:hypothetical protein
MHHPLFLSVTYWFHSNMDCRGAALYTPAIRGGGLGLYHLYDTIMDIDTYSMPVLLFIISGETL